MKIFFCDIDGVLTTGKKIYGKDGMPHSKEFFDKDFTALKQFSAAGFDVIFVSSDVNINESVIKNRNYRFFYSRGKSKKEVILENFQLEKYKVIMACGDDIFDIPMMELATHRISTQDAHFLVKKICQRETDFISNKTGGNGVIQDMAEHYYNEFLSDITLIDIEKIDSLEKF